MKAKKEKSFLNPTRPIIIWVASLIIFHILLYLSGNDSSKQTDWIIFVLLANISVGFLAFAYSGLLILRNLFSKTEIKKSLIYTLILLAVTLLFFYSLTLIQNNDVKTKSQKRCYLDSYRWIMADETDNCEELVRYQLDAEKKQRESTIENQKIETTSTNQKATSNNNWEEAWKVEKIDDKTTDSRFPEDDRMGTAEELFIAINNFRQAHNISSVQKHDTLCRIAQTRANQLLELGQLDGHVGMNDLAHSQQDFDNMGEVISGGTQKELAVHTVEWGWGRSLTGHRESILNKKWTHGCGGVSGLFSVFVFGSN